MKILLAVLFTSFAFTSFSQEWTTHEFDENLTLEVPAGFDVIDTLGQHFVRAQIDNALVMIQRLVNEGVNAAHIANKEDLAKAYKEFAGGVAEGHQGKLLKQTYRKLDGLDVTEFSISATMNGERQLRRFLVVFLNDNWYAVQFWEVEGLADELQPSRDRLFASLAFPPSVTLLNQINTEDSIPYKIGQLIGYVFMTLVFGGAIGIVMFLIFRKKKRPAKYDI